MPILSNALIPPTAPAGLCQLPLQQQINILWAATQLNITALNNLLIQADEPGVDERDKAWARLIGAELYLERIYIYANGDWTAPHPVPASSDYRALWVGSEPSLETFDGGESGVITATTGPMWLLDEDFEGRMLMMPGDIPGVTPTKTLAVGENYGSGMTTIEQENLPDVDFDLNVSELSQQPGSGAQGGLMYQGPGTGSGDAANPTNLIVNSGGDGTPINVVGPVRGIYLIRRSARTQYRAI